MYPALEITLSQFRKKPIVIEAFLWTGGPDQEEDPTWFLAEMAAGRARIKDGGSRDVHILIDTLEGTMRASQGDYIIKGVKGEVYPCKPDIFAATYEAVPAAT